MVTVKRRSSEPQFSPLPLVGSADRGNAFTFRDALESPRVALAQALVGRTNPQFRLAPQRSPFGSSGARFTQQYPSDSNFYVSRKLLSQQQINNRVPWLIKVIYAAAVVSAIVSFCVSDASALATDVETETIATQAHLEHIQRDFETARSYVEKERLWLNKLKKSRKALEHEVRMIKEVRESSGKHMPATPSNERMIQSWLDHRKDGLLIKIQYLQSYLQEESLRTVREKYGEGPHKVKMTVDHLNEKGRRQTTSFTVELAASEWMPHAILFFLDTVQNKLWDHTVFMHHEDTEHVIVAAPIDYNTQRIKHLQLNQLGWLGLGFPEYREDYPHVQYTLGFSGQGPTIYINTKDNTKSHGPGGQGHHLLETDAEPCFGRVIKNDEAAVDEIIRLADKQNKSNMDGHHPWVDDEHTWTHIVTAEIVNNNLGTTSTALH